MILLYLLISIMPFMRHPLWSQVVGDMTMTKILGASCLLYAAYYLTQREVPARYFSTPQSWWYVLISIIAISELPRALSFNPVFSYLSYLMLFFITVTVVDTLPRMKYILLAAVASVGYGSLHMLREWQTSRGLYAEYRPGYVVGDANYFAISAVICIPLAWCLLPTLKARWQWFMCLGSMIVTSMAFVLASSRGGLLGLVAAWSLMLIRLGRQSRRALIVTCLAVPPLLLLPMSPVVRLLNPTHTDDASAATRTALWKIGLDLIRDNPLHGVGLGNFKQMTTSHLPDGSLQHVAHNSYIEIAAEMGIPTVIIFIAVLVAAIISLGRVRRLAKESEQNTVWRAAVGIECGLVGAAVCLFFISGQYQKLYWFMLCASACLPQFGRRWRRKRVRATVDRAVEADPLEVGLEL